jgi:hypothetical protein
VDSNFVEYSGQVSHSRPCARQKEGGDKGTADAADAASTLPTAALAIRPAIRHNAGEEPATKTPPTGGMVLPGPARVAAIAAPAAATEGR